MAELVMLVVICGFFTLAGFIAEATINVPAKRKRKYKELYSDNIMVDERR